MKKTTIEITLKGIRPIMFDRFVSMKTELSPEEKVYKVGENLVFPTKNIMSFLSATNTESAPKRILGKKYKAVAKAALSFINFHDENIFFTRDGKKINCKEITILEDKAIVMKGSSAIPSPKQRPILSTDWNLTFKLDLYENDDLNESMLKQLFDIGGLTIGFGTYRGVYGKFIIDKWNVA
jgi:hypothetical protein